ncbi:MAG: SDR family oxidoreductase [Phycisphaerales bacterium]|jgi:NAD(P)-dependent dehydrogenase (short-subunit alcohol dehydrogenase family)|nr:SDR family oxidoreductase [Phycisphaerales bacterium]
MESPVVIITGASRGIGRSTAGELTRRGYRTALVARSEDRLREVAAKTNGLAIVADITQPDQVKAIVAKTLEQFGRIDALVNCAGVAPSLMIEQMTVERWKEVIDTNLSAVFYLCKEVWETFKGQKNGVIVNLSSLAARDPFPGFLAYGSAKAGLHILGLSLARQGQEHGIRVHTLALGAVETDMFRQLMTPEQFPPSQTMTPHEVAQTIASCVTGELRHTSGEVIYLHKKV